MRVLGIDPGVTGAWAVVDVTSTDQHPLATDLQSGHQSRNQLFVGGIGDLATIPIKLSKRITRRLDVHDIGKMLDDVLPTVDRVVVERLTGAPGIASTTSFNLGWTGAVLDTLLTERGWQHRYLNPAPSAWKRSLLVPADKSAARRRATVLFGTDKHWRREKDHNRAEAALLALWGALRT